MVVGEAGDGDEVVQQIEVHQPDVLVLDLIMPRVKGLDIIEELIAAHPNLRILVLTMHADAQYVRHVLKAGCAGYVTKSSADTELITAIREVAKGKSYLSPEATEVLLQDYRQQDEVNRRRGRPAEID